MLFVAVILNTHPNFQIVPLFQNHFSDVHATLKWAFWEEMFTLFFFGNADLLPTPSLLTVVLAEGQQIHLRGETVRKLDLLILS